MAKVLFGQSAIVQFAIFGEGDKVFSGEFTVKDVCETCNNGELSKLDRYLCVLYDRYFAKIVEDGTSVEFEYDFGRLTRWLLKISYNSSRTTGNHRRPSRSAHPRCRRETKEILHPS